MNIGIFGFAIPYAAFGTRDIVVHNLTFDQDSQPSAADRFIEPFMDPFASNFLRRLTNGALNHFGAVVMMRDCPGALVAFHYACQLDDMGLLPNSAPKLILCNLVTSAGPDVAAFNQQELKVLVSELAPFTGPKVTSNPSQPPRRSAREVLSQQSNGRLSGSQAYTIWAGNSFPKTRENWISPNAAGPRMALFGAPLGNDHLHQALDQIGVLAVDQQCLTSAWLDEHPNLAGFASNPLAARQSADLFLSHTEAILKQNSISKLLWQVDHHDDLWGWLAPSLRDMTRRLSCEFVDLGFLPRWPNHDLVSATINQVTA